MLLKWEVGGQVFNSHGNYIVDRGKSWNNHGIVFFNFCGSPKCPNCTEARIYIVINKHLPRVLLR